MCAASPAIMDTGLPRSPRSAVTASADKFRCVVADHRVLRDHELAEVNAFVVHEPGPGMLGRSAYEEGIPHQHRLGLLPGSLAIPPVTLRRSTTPDDPLRLANSGASGAAPTRLTMKASSLTDFEAARRFVTCCLRFTTGVAARHARLASGWRAAPLPGGSRTRWIATRGFRSSHPPLQGFPWRNIRSFSG